MPIQGKHHPSLYFEFILWISLWPCSLLWMSSPFRSVAILLLIGPCLAETVKLCFINFLILLSTSVPQGFSLDLNWKYLQLWIRKTPFNVAKILLDNAFIACTEDTSKPINPGFRHVKIWLCGVYSMRFSKDTGISLKLASSGITLGRQCLTHVVFYS